MKPLLIMLIFTSLCVNAQSYKNAELPDAMTFLDGTKVKTRADWEKRKTEIKNLFHNVLDLVKAKK